MEHETHSHPTVGTYLRVFGLLVILTIIEVGVFYVPQFQNALVPILVGLSTFKFLLVVMFYMHLKNDSKFFTFLFAVPLVLAMAVIAALLLLFGVWQIG